MALECRGDRGMMHSQFQLYRGNLEAREHVFAMEAKLAQDSEVFRTQAGRCGHFP